MCPVNMMVRIPVMRRNRRNKYSAPARATPRSLPNYTHHPSVRSLPSSKHTGNGNRAVDAVDLVYTFRHHRFKGAGQNATDPACSSMKPMMVLSSLDDHADAFTQYDIARAGHNKYPVIKWGIGHYLIKKMAQDVVETPITISSVDKQVAESQALVNNVPPLYFQKVITTRLNLINVT